MTLVPGTCVGPYEVVSPLGQGGMGEVYRARDSRLGREVALKVLPLEYSSSPERRERFVREARAVARLNHPNVLVIRCLDKDPLRRFSKARDVSSALRALQEPGAAVAERAKPLPPAVAVLAFKKLGDQEENAHLAIGLADAIITELARSESLVVRPTASILRYRGAPDPLSVGRELEVGAVLDGKFQRAGDRLRLTLQLLDVADGNPLWADKIDGKLGDIFALQDKVAARVAEALSVRLGASRLRAGEKLTTGAYELYLEGRVHLYRETVESVHKAISCFEEVRRRDPSFPQAWVGLADAFLRMAFTFEPEADWYERAEEMCDRALALDPGLPEARYAKGRLLWTPSRGFDHVGALRELGAAVRGSPGLGEAHLWIGTILFHVSLLDEAAQALERALAIDPEDMLSLDMMALTRYYQGRFPEALEMSARAVEKSPTNWGEYQLALCQIQTGELKGAERRATRGRERFPQSVLFYSVQGLLAALRGDAAAAREAIGLVEANPGAFGHYHHAQYDVACIWSILGEPALALKTLAAAAENGFPCRDFFAVDPLLDGLRGTPEFGALLQELGGEVENYRRIYRLAVEGTHLAVPAAEAEEGSTGTATQ